MATRVNLGNKNNEGTFINLKVYIYIQTYIHTYIYICLDIVLLILVMDDEQGIAIGNGLTYPEIQYPMYRDYALQMKLINQADYFSLNSSVAQCAQAAHLCGKIKKESFLQKFLKKILIFALNSNEIFFQVPMVWILVKQHIMFATACFKIYSDLLVRV